MKNIPEFKFYKNNQKFKFFFEQKFKFLKKNIKFFSKKICSPQLEKNILRTAHLSRCGIVSEGLGSEGGHE